VPLLAHSSVGFIIVLLKDSEASGEVMESNLLLVCPDENTVVIHIGQLSVSEGKSRAVQCPSSSRSESLFFSAAPIGDLNTARQYS
jgi:hypothetical protein